MQRNKVRIVPASHFAALVDRGRNLTSAGHEAQHVALRPRQYRVQRRRDRFSGCVLDVQRMQRSRDVDDRTVIQERRHRTGIERRRHHDDAKIRAREPGLFRQRETEVRVNAALVKFIDHDRGDVAQQRILLEVCGQDALSDDKEASGLGEVPLETDVPADLAAERPALFFGDAPGHGPRRNPPRLQQQHAAAIHERGWHSRRLAGAGRGHQHGRSMAFQCIRNARQVGINGQGRRHGVLSKLTARGIRRFTAS